MKKGEIYTGIVSEYEFPNKGIVVLEDTRVTVKNSLPGQKISFRLLKKRQNRGTGQLIKILEPGNIEDGCSFCDNYGKCGSCLYQTLTYDRQAGLKKDMVLSLIDKVCTDYEFDGIKTSPDIYGYRNKMEYTFGDEVKDGPLTLGLHKRGSFYDIINADCCKLVHEDFGIILNAVRTYCRDNNLPYYHRITHEGYLRHLLIRRAVRTGELLVDIVTTSSDEYNIDELTDIITGLKLAGTIAGILHTVNNSVADTINDEGTTVLYGKDYFYEELLDLRFRISPFAFFQTNSLGAEVLYSTAREYIKDYINDKVIYDLYSGTGTIAQLLAPVAKKVIGVEIIQEAVLAAKENAAINGLDNCEFIAGDVLKVLDNIDGNYESPDMIVLDPPRDGVHPKALRHILEYGVDNILYISCKPTSLVRDIEVMQEFGYEVRRVAVVDMFPWTAHVETVVLLSKGTIPSKKVKVEFSLEEMNTDGFKDGATYEEITKWVQDKYGFHVTNLNIAQVKQKHGIIERENYNKPKSENSRQPGCPEEKVKAIEEALKHFNMI